MFNIIKKINKNQKYQIVRKGDVAKKILLTGAFTGILGVVSTFLTAKKNGEQNRKEIMKASQKLGYDAKKNLEKFNEFSSDLKDKMQSEADSDFKSIKGKVKEVAHNTKKLIKKATSPLTASKRDGKVVVDVEIEEDKKD